MRKLKLREVRLLAKHYIIIRQPKIQIHIYRNPRLNSLSPVKMRLSLGKVAHEKLSVTHCSVMDLCPIFSKKVLIKKLKVLDSTKGEDRGQERRVTTKTASTTPQFHPALHASSSLRARKRGKGRCWKDGEERKCCSVPKVLISKKGRKRVILI